MSGERANGDAAPSAENRIPGRAPSGGFRGILPMPTAALDVIAVVLACSAVLHPWFVIAWGMGQSLEGDPGWFAWIVAVLLYLVLPGALIAIPVGFHSSHMDRGPSWRRNHRTRILLTGLLASCLEIPFFGVAAWIGISVILTVELPLQPEAGSSALGIHAMGASLILAALLALISLLAPLFLFVQTVLAIERDTPLRPLIREGHWLILMAFVLSYLAFALVVLL